MRRGRCSAARPPTTSHQKSSTTSKKLPSLSRSGKPRNPARSKPGVKKSTPLPSATAGATCQAARVALTAKPRVPRQPVAVKQPKPHLVNLRAVLFLDVDGVLHSNKVRHTRQYFSAACMALLAEVVSTTRCAIVLSTSWRLDSGHRRTVAAKLQGSGIPVPVSRTPSIAQFQRGLEILSWVDQYKPQAWVVVDDWPLSLETAATKRLDGRFVQTKPQYGLQGDTKDQIIQLFERQLQGQ